METTNTLYTAVQKCYDHLYNAITELAKHPDDDNCAMWEATAHNDYDRALEAYVMAREKEAKAARDRGELPSPPPEYTTSGGYRSSVAGGSGKGPSSRPTVARCTHNGLPVNEKVVTLNVL